MRGLPSDFADETSVIYSVVLVSFPFDEFIFWDFILGIVNVDV